MYIENFMYFCIRKDDNKKDEKTKLYIVNYIVMKTKENKKMSPEARKMAWKLAELVFFALSFVSVLLCFGDGVYNGRLFLGCVLLCASYQCHVKARKEGE